MDQSRRGYLYGAFAYLMWGFFPIYFKVLLPSGDGEILAHRIVWSALFVGILLTGARRWRDVAALRHLPRTLAGVALAGTLIAVNWFTYIYAVNSGHVVEASLGYFINPLISVAFGVALFGERLRRGQLAALAVGAVAVIVLTIDYGRPPYLALLLAVSFGAYGTTKKRLALPPMPGLFLETGVLALPALAYLVLLGAAGHSTFGTISPWHTTLLALAGVITAVPLLMFAGAANRIPMTGLGILQYLTPSLQLIIGVALYHEPLPAAELVGFVLVWLALLVFTWDAVRFARRAGSSAAALSPATEPATGPTAAPAPGPATVPAAATPPAPATAPANS